ncbi:MAG: hypothetical protein RIS34_2362 [Pseudomonadota bacterium]|jgi:hypothetical protein
MSALQNYAANESFRFMPDPVPEMSTYGADASKAWLTGPLETFSLCMASYGLCVSSTLMLDDKQYATQQISCAQTLADETLSELAVALSRQLKLQ